MLISGSGCGLSFETFVPSRPSQVCKKSAQDDQEDPIVNPRQVDVDAVPLDKSLKRDVVEPLEYLAEQESTYTRAA